MRKLIVVTGGSKGIGRAVLEKFVLQGFDGVTCSRHMEDLQSLKSDFERMYPGSTIYCHESDMSVKSGVKAFTDFALQLNKPLHVLVNNTGYFIPGEIATEPEGNLETMMNANLFSAYHTTRGLLPKMKASESGHIFNMCSIASIQAYKNGGSYAISKFALLGFSKCLREELKHLNIRVTAVLPGATKTRSWEGINLPDDRFISVEDVANTIFSAYSLSAGSVVEEIILRPQLGDI